MRYLCLIYEAEAQWATMSKEQGDQMMGEYFAFTDDIKKGGQYVGGEALQPTHSATTVRVRKGKISTTDGPFAETKEQLGGYYIVECANLDEAIEAAGKIPAVKYGSVEVRPLLAM
jgi:hypothetical protein